MTPTIVKAGLYTAALLAAAVAAQAGAQSSGPASSGVRVDKVSLIGSQETIASIAVISDAAPASSVEAAPADAAHDSPETTVTAAVVAWSRAWAQGDVPSYLASYADDFSPGNGVTHGEWQRQRSARIKSSAHKAIQIGSVNVEVFGADIAQASFQQEYHSDVYKDQAIKVLDLLLVDGHWKITGETALADQFQ